MSLTAGQKTQLKNDINANTNTVELTAGNFVQIKDVPNTTDTNAAIAVWYNLTASPAFTAWRRLVTLSEIAKKLNGTELAGLSSLNHTRLQTVIALLNAAGGLDASLADQRQFFDDIFSGAGGATTRVSLLALWKRTATNIQKLFSTGTGSDAAPATTQDGVGDAYAITGADVTAARNS
jgi:hypothetical protein